MPTFNKDYLGRSLLYVEKIKRERCSPGGLHKITIFESPIKV